MWSKSDLQSFLHGTRTASAKRPVYLEFRSSKTFIITTVVVAVFTDVFLYSVVIPVLPFALDSRAGVPADETQKWTSIFLAVYGAALGVGSLLFGYLADKTKSRRMPLLLGLLALGGSTAMLCAGRGLALLLAGRILQGLSASVVWTVGLALLSDAVPKDEIGQAMGYAAGAYSGAAIAGPILGGIMYKRAGYYAVFAMTFAIIGLDIILRLIMIERHRAEQWLNSDTNEPNQQDQNIGMTQGEKSTKLQTSLEEPSETGAQRVNEDSLAPISSVSESKWLNRLPAVFTLLRHSRLLAACFGCFVQAACLTAFEAVLPLYVNEIWGWDSEGAGLMFIALVVPALFSPLVGHLADTYGSRVIPTIGFIGGVPFWVLLRLVNYNTIGQKVLLCVLLTIIGCSLTLVAPPLMAEIDHILSVEERLRPGSLGKGGAAAQGYGLFNFAFACGTLAGPLWGGFVRQDSDWSTVGWTIGLLSGVAGIVTFIWIGGRIKLGSRKPEEEAAV